MKNKTFSVEVFLFNDLKKVSKENDTLWKKIIIIRIRIKSRDGF